MDSVRTASALIVSLMCASAMAQDAVQWRVEDGGNGHWYEVVQYGIGRTHAEATALASQVGARLVSIGSEPENAFVESLALPYGVFAAFTLGGAQDLQAPDYSEPAGGWRWDDGTTWGFTNWDCGVCAEEVGAGWWCQPDNYIDQHYLVGVICMNRLVWDDGTVTNAERRAIYEWSADCNNDGLVDYGQILSGDLADGDGDVVPDICDPNGPPSGIARFDEASDTIRILGNTAFGLGDFTYEMRVRIAAGAPIGQVISEQRNATEDKSIALAANGDYVVSACGRGTGNFSGTMAGFPSGEWIHLAYVRTGDIVSLYLDGALIRTESATACYGDSSDSWMSIGMFVYGAGYIPAGPTPSFMGDLDWIRVSARARYTTTFAPPFECDIAADADTELLLRFNDPAGTMVLIDESPNHFVCDLGVPVTPGYLATAPALMPSEGFPTCGCAADTDGDGTADCADGCPLNPALPAPATYYRDADQDSFGNASDATSVCSTTPPDGYVADNTDCDDTVVLYEDADGDGVGIGDPIACGGVPVYGDYCPLNPDLLWPINFYYDGDGDGFGDPTRGYPACSTTPPIGYVTNGDDCNDELLLYVDADSDGYGSLVLTPCYGVSSNDDCNDSDASVYPGAPETCLDIGVDNDCDGDAIEGPAPRRFYYDGDCDGYPSQVSAWLSCSPPWGCWVEENKWIPMVWDCDDSQFLYEDIDGDGFGFGAPAPCGVPNNLDCDDNLLTFQDLDQDGFGAGTTVPCGGVTNNVDCNDQQILYADNDGDTHGAGAPVACGVESNDDCNDSDASVYPGAPELCSNLGVDNDCDGDTSESEATDRNPCYIDADGDGFTAPEPIFYSCSPCNPPSWIPDCDDGQLLYADLDGDGFGSGAPAPCGVPNNADQCEGDPNKIQPGICGCGTADSDVDADGRIDCRDVELQMTVVAIDRADGGLVRVRVDARTMQPVAEMIGLQCSMTFDATRLQVVDISPVVDAPLATELAEVVDPAAGTIRYALGAFPPAGGFVSDAALFEVTLQFVPGADFCAWAELMRFAMVGGSGSMLAVADGTVVAPSESWNTTVLLDVTAPTLSAVPDPVSLPFDAGSDLGAMVEEWSYLVWAQDACGASLERVVTLPGGATTTAWPWIFPEGISRVSYRAWDAFGNAVEHTTSITVHPYQLLDATVVLDGAFDPALPPFGRGVRIDVGASSSMHALTLVPTLAPSGNATARTARILGMQVPVTAGIPCASAKDTAYSLSDLGDIAIVGTRYDATFTLRQGDSNDDDVVDILDFGSWYVDVGPAGAAGRSNFNADAFVNTGDFAWIGLHFFARGERCGGFAPPGAPLARISVKELRRRGLGELAAADVNHDGWLDERDVAAAMAGGGGPVPTAAGTGTGADAPTSSW